MQSVPVDDGWEQGVPSAPAEAIETRPRGWSTRVRIASVAAVVLLSLGAHLWGLTRDLPMPDVDERYFVTPAAYIAASGDLNPHWFGHPGSTVIYPLAAAFRLREVVFHGASLTGTAPSVAARFMVDPESFYLMGRLWSMLFSLAALVLVFAIGRRVFGDLVALLATALWALVPLGVQYGKITRTDSVALFFALFTIWACLRALERPSIGRFATAGVAAGLGVASRYFLAALVVLLCVTWLAVRGHGERRRALSPRRSTPLSLITVALGAMAATFVITTPYFFLDWHDAMTSLNGETVTVGPSQSSSVFDNLAFYLTHAIPNAISWVGLAAALVGLILALRRRTPARILLLLWVPCVLVVVSVPSLHWERWIIPAMPVLVLFAAYASVTVARTMSAGLRSPAARGWAFLAVLGVAMVVMAVGPASALVALDHREAETSTRLVAATWITQHIPAGNGVAVEIKGPDLSNTHYRYVEHYALPAAGTIADYARDGYRYLVINAFVAHRYLMQGRRFRMQAAFYNFLREDTTRLADFRHDDAHGGPHLELYDLGPTADPRERDSIREAPHDEATLRFTFPNRVRRGDHPVPFAYHQLLRLAPEAQWGGHRDMAARDLLRAA